MNLQFMIHHKDGSERWIEHVCQPVYDAEGNFLGRRGSNFDITERKEADRKIVNAIISTEETERNKFSRELHDGLGPMLSSIKLYFQWLSESTDLDKRINITNTGLQNIDDAIQTMREISNRLSPIILYNSGLVPALKYLIKRINETQKLFINFNFDKERRYNPQIEITIYRIVTELLNNTFKHSVANEVEMILSVNDNTNKIKLRYTDNGKGFNINQVLENKKGMGIYNMIHRIETLNGIINFDTEEGKPLIVTIEIPFMNESQT